VKGPLFVWFFLTNKADDLENRQLSVIIFLYQSVGKKEAREK